jgi:two-component system chemotaxis sensor kinase CheA
VGLDVVRETAVRLKGEVTVQSEPGRGTVVEICVPTSVSSETALLVEAAETAAAIPLDAVRAALRVSAAAVIRSAHSESIAYDGGMIPLVPLARLLRPAAASAWSTPPIAVVLRAGVQVAAVGVDRLLTTDTVMARPLPALAHASPVVAAAALDADGNPQLLLDPGAVVAAACGEQPPRPAVERPRRLPVLVIDDSLTTRMLEQSILESAGYEVEVATSAEEALGKARERRYGAFIVDVEMPGMDGFEFVAHTRADPACRDVPSILVTSRSSSEDRRRGDEVGARAFIVKSQFDQTHLLELIRGLVG